MSNSKFKSVYQHIYCGVFIFLELQNGTAVVTLSFFTGYSVDCAIKTDRIELPQDKYLLRDKKRI